MAAMTLEIEEIVIHYLRSLSALKAIVGDAIYGETADPRAPIKRVEVEKTSDERLRELEGPSGYSMPEIDIVCRAAKRKDANRIAKAIRGTEASPALDDLCGEWIGPVGKRVWIQAVEVSDATSEHDNPIDGSERGPFATRLRAQFFFNESEAEG